MVKWSCHPTQFTRHLNFRASRGLWPCPRSTRPSTTRYLSQSLLSYGTVQNIYLSINLLKQRPFFTFQRDVMCVLFVKFLKSAKPGEFKLILASNRDELFKRPGKTAHFWEEDDNIFGGFFQTALPIQLRRSCKVQLLFSCSR